MSPGHSFLYQFNVPNQAGTFWYHSHLCAPIRFEFLCVSDLSAQRRNTAMV
ncbi:multicopper oxidase domain-containing protein [Alkalibacillus haloalkaliphilus]|uniref:multicopper oxidase domain-containing protein n=1 Tax=Alkalibacillus haloalkaliphilus TaxID=94136 RepID=UPI0034DE0392